MLKRAVVCFNVLVLSLICLTALGQSPLTPTIYEAIQQGLVTAKFTGSGITSVSVRITRSKGSKPLRLRIPLGTLFVSGSESSAQNMVATAAKAVDLTSAQVVDVSIPAACANLHLDVPGEEDNFQVQAIPEQEELQRVLPVLAAAGVSDSVTQAAVWMVTDDATYDDLGTLVAGLGGFGGARVINEPEAARAMMLLEKAKVDLRDRAIWADANPICEEVAGTEAAASLWCTSILRDKTDLDWKLESLDHERRAVRNIARTGLAKETNPDSLPRLIEVLPTLKGDAAAAVITALGNYKAPEALKTISAALESGDVAAQRAAAAILLKNEDPALREAATIALAKLKQRTPAPKPSTSRVPAKKD